MIDTSTKTRKFRHLLLLWLLLMPLLTVCIAASTFAVQSVIPGTVTTVHADSPDDSSDDSSKSSSSSDDSSKSSSSTSNDASAWNTALSQLSESAVSENNQNKSSSSDTDNSSKKDQATFKAATSGGHYLNVWGFMGNGNTDVWEKNNNSSWTVSYNSLIEGAGDGAGDAYKVAGRFAYALQSTGLDQPVKSGFTSVGMIDKVGGWIMQLSYFVLDSAESLFKIALSILSAINPINWALYGAGSSNAVFSGLANTVHRLYELMKGVGWAICGIILAASLALAAMGVTVGTGTAHIGPGRALLNVFSNLLKRLFVWTVLPVFGLAFFGATIDNVKDAFETESNSVPNYAVYGAYVDYNNWVMNSRLGLPNDVTLNSSFDNKKAFPLTHSQILAINYKGAGINGLSNLYNTISSNGDALSNSSSSGNTGVDDYAKSVLKSWTSGSSITAADYASAADPDIRNAAKAANKKDNKKDAGSPDLSAELVKGKYNYNSTDQVTSANNSAIITGRTFRPNSNTMSGTDSSGGLSTLGTYAYMLTTASNDKMTIADTENLSNDVAQPEHRATVLVGTGIVSTGNLVWAFGMMVGLALLVVGYLLEVLKTIIQSIPAITMATLQTALMSLKGGVQFISVLAGLFIGVFGSAVMYLIAQLAYISVAEFSDSVITGQFATSFVNLVGMQGDTSVGRLASGASSTTVMGAANIAYGVFLLWLAYLLLRYRGVMVASMASLVEETVNKIMATFGNLSGQGSSGTRGAIMQNSNTDNTWANNAAGLAKTAGMGALFAGGTAGLSSLAKGAGSLGKAGSNKSTGKESAKEKEKNTNSRQNSNSSANKLGNAAERTNTGKGRNSANNNNSQNAANKLDNNRDNNLQNPEKTATANGLNDNANDQNQNGLQNTGYTPNDSTQNAGDMNSIGKNSELTDANNDQLYNTDANDLTNQDGDENGLNQDQNNLSQNDQGDTNQKGLTNNGLENQNSNESNLDQNSDNQTQASQNAGDELNENGDQNSLGQNENANGLDNSASDGIGQSSVGSDGLADRDNASTISAAVADSDMQQDHLADELGVGQNGMPDQNGLSGDTNTNNSLGDSNSNNALGDSNSENSVGDSNSGSMLGDSDATTNNALGDSSQNDSLGDNRNGDETQNSVGDSNSGSMLGDSDATTNDALGDSSQNNSLGDNRNGDETQNSIGDSNSGSMLGDSDAMANNALGDSSQNNSLGDNRNGDETQNSRATQLGSSLGDTNNSQSLGQATSNDLSTHVPVNSDMSAQDIQSQMGDIQNANVSANSANSLAAANPNNQTLSQRAETANNTLRSLQSNALSDYTQQAVSSGSPQSQWLSSDTSGKSISVGTADNAMNSVYNAQNDLGSATSRYGADSSQAKNAASHLDTVRQNAVKSGLSSKVVNDTKAVGSAHNAISENASNLMKGTWKPQVRSKSNSIAHLGNDTGRTIGI